LDALTSPCDKSEPWLPPAAPLDMPVQDLWVAPTAVLTPQTDESAGAGRETDAWRVGMVGLTIAMVFFPARAFYGVLSIGGFTFLDVTTLVLFVLLFAWLAFALVQAATGFCLMVTGGARILEAELAAPDARVLAAMEAGRCALLMPIYNEDVEAVFARLQAVDQSLAQAQGQTFDIFVLSDTRDPAIQAQERQAFEALRLCISPGRGPYYRHRRENIGRKAGNIADWVRTFGAAYETMVVLDADSLMEGEMLVRLAAAMARRPTLGLIQTVPLIVNRTSLFARVQQFASRLYGPMLSEGLAWWSGSEGNYWGHNAIIRTRAFAEQAGLPRLPGRKPFGGEILSHDFVEAALLRRGGWDVRMAPQLYGSFEECPPSLPDLIVRERRWCQGNLQHSIVIAARGLHWNSRLHMMRGVSAYMTAPLSLAFILAGAVQTLVREQAGAGQWGLPSLRVASWVFSLGIGALIAPKVLSLWLVLIDGPQRRAWGSSGKLCLSFLLETILTSLIAPILMFAEVQAFIDVLFGRDSGWAAQRRSDGPLTWREAVRHHRSHTIMGVALAVIAYFASPATLLWMAPVVVGLLAAAPISLVSSSPALGAWLRDRGVLLTPEERHPPEVLNRFVRILGESKR
jgi:membrane glycosyltransferase